MLIKITTPKIKEGTDSYFQNEIRDVSDARAEYFIKNKWAVPHTEPAPTDQATPAAATLDVQGSTIGHQSEVR